MGLLPKFNYLKLEKTGKLRLIKPCDGVKALLTKGPAAPPRKLRA